MNKNLVRGAFGIILGLVAITVPAYCDPVLTFGTGGGGTVSYNTANNTLSSFSNVAFTTVTIAGASNSADNGIWNIVASESWTAAALGGSNLYTFTGTFGACVATCTGGNLNGDSINVTAQLAFVTGGPGTGPNDTFTSSPATVSVGLGTATTLTGVSGNFLTAIGAPNSLALVQTGGLSGSGTPSISGSTDTWNVPSASLKLDLAPVPEPSSLFMLGGGLLMLAVAVCRRSVKA
jgi:hypothetical protein